MKIHFIPRWVRLLAGAFMVLLLFFLLAPLLVVIVASFTETRFIRFPPQGFSFEWYASALFSGRYLAAARLSFTIALLVTLTATVIGGLAAVALHRRALPGTGLLSALFLAPLVLPTIIYAVGLLMLWSLIVGSPSAAAIWLGHTLLALPYVVRTTLAVLTDADPFLEEAARTMGAGRWQCLRLVTVPQALPGLAAGAFFAFNISFDEAILALFLRTPDVVTLPIQIYSELEFSPDPSIAAVSSLMILLVVVLVFIIDRLFGVGKFASN